MRIVHRVKNGFYVEPVIIQDNEPIPRDCVDAEFPDGTHLPAKLVNGRFETTLTQEEINKIKNQSQQKSQVEILQETVEQLVLDNLMRGL